MALINAHEHLQSARELPLLLESMDALGVERVVLLGSPAFTLTSDHRLGFTRYLENNLELLGAARAHADRVEAWPTLHPLDPDNLAHLRSYHERGATGLKLYLGHGFVAPGSSEYLFGMVAMDDPRLSAVYDYCAEHRLPVCLHVNPGPRTPGFADELVSLLERHPRLLVNAPHWILSTGRLDRLGELLDVFPSLCTDLSFGADEFLAAGLRRLSRGARRARELVVRHPSRFLFGTDFVITRARHKTVEWMRTRVQAYLAMLTCDRYETSLCPGQILDGLALPPGLVERVGSQNYLELRASEREPMPPVRPVDWSRLGVARVPRRPGERLPPPVPGTVQPHIER